MHAVADLSRVDSAAPKSYGLNQGVLEEETSTPAKMRRVWLVEERQRR